MPVVKQYEAMEPDDRLNQFPTFPAEHRVNEPHVLTLLRDAMQVADREPGRYATGHVRLRGSDGSLAATDGRRLLVQTGVAFPSADEILIPRTALFNCSELHALGAPVELGRTGDWFAVRVGSWTFFLQINKEGRFPRVDDLLTDGRTDTTRLALGAADAEFLTKALGKLPGGNDLHQPITVDLNGSVALRARGADMVDVTELVLCNSTRDGEPVRLQTDRRYLAQALRLGFRELHVRSAESPLCCRDAQRQYIWAPLDAKSALPLNDGARRIESPTAEPSPTSLPRRTITMPRSTAGATDNSP